MHRGVGDSLTVKALGMVPPLGVISFSQNLRPARLRMIPGVI